jgi:hypothetical protein
MSDVYVGKDENHFCIALNENKIPIECFEIDFCIFNNRCTVMGES